MILFVFRDINSEKNIDVLNAIWPGAMLIIAPTHNGIHIQRNPLVPSSQGRIFVAINPIFSPFVSTHSITLSGRAIWLHLDHPQWGSFGIVFIYAPNLDLARTALWCELFDPLDPTRPWMLVGDLNMIDDPTDHSGGLAKVIIGAKKGHDLTF